MNDTSDRSNLREGMLFEFDGFQFDRARCLLSRDGKLIPASRKVLETLACLLEGAPNPVSKSELMAKVWPDVIIEETGLHRNISLVRKLLSSQTGKQYIETMPKLGYRFTGDLKICAAAPPSDPISFIQHIPTSTSTPESLSSNLPPRTSRLRKGAAFLVAACVAATVVACYSMQPSAKQTVRVTPVTTRSQERPIVAAAINAEGTQIAYAERDALFIKALDEVDATEVPLPKGWVPSHVRWVPGNHELVLSATNVQTEQSSIWMLSLEGGVPRQLIHDGSAGSTSPDGRYLLFVRDRSEVLSADLKSGDERGIAEAPGNHSFVYPPQFSPDGQYILDGLYKPTDPQTTIEVRRVVDGKIVTTIKLPRLQAFSLLGRDELLVSVFSSRGIPPVAIAIQKFDWQRGAIGSMRKVVQWSDATAYRLTASADARKVVLIRDRTQSDVYLADVASGTHALQNVRRLTFDEASDFPWGWTPDSKSVLFHSLRAQTFHVYQQSYDKTSAHDLVADNRDSKYPLMTADGRWLFYFSEQYPYSDGPLAVTLMRQPAGSSAAAQPIASFNHDDVGLRCAIHSSRCVIIDQTTSSAKISDLQVDTGIVQHLFDAALVSRHYQQWAVSPAGDRLALLNDSGIHIFSLPSGRLEHEIVLGGSCALRALAWDPSGTGFYLSKTSNELGMIEHVSEAGEETALYSGPMSGGAWVIPAPDGSRIAFQQWVPSANAWMLEFKHNGTRADETIQKLANLRL